MMPRRRDQPWGIDLPSWNWQVLAWLSGLVCAGSGGLLAVHADDYRQQVAPLLNKNCVACHNAKTAEGGLNLENYGQLMAGGNSGAAVVVGQADSSELIARLLATDDSVMPPEDNGVGAQRLTPEEVARIADWINAGATPPSSDALPTIQWRSISQAVQPIYAVGLSADGQYLSFAKGNVVYLVPQPDGAATWEPLPLLDEQLRLPDGSPVAATDLDLVHSIAFSHDSQRLAVGGFRTVKLWERQVHARKRPDWNAPDDGEFLPTTGRGPGPITRDDRPLLTIWDPETRQPLQSLGPLPSQPVTAAWATDRSFLEVLDQAGQLWRWQPNPDDPTGHWVAQPRTLVEPPVEPLTMAVAADNQTWVVSRDGTVWRVVPDGEKWRAELAFATERTLRAACVSSDAQWLSAVDEGGVATLWRISDGGLVHTLGEDYLRWQRRQETERQISRLEGWVKRLTEMRPGLEEEIKKEEEARTKVAETHQKALEAQQAKEQEIAAAQQTVAVTEQGIADLEQQLAEKRQQLSEQQKAVSDLQSQLPPLQQNVAKAEQALASAEAGLQLAREKVPAHVARIDSQQQELVATQASLEHLVAQESADVVAMTFDRSAQQVLLIDRTGRGCLYRTSTGRPVAVLAPPTEFSPEPNEPTPGQTSQRALGQTWHGDENRIGVQVGAQTWEWDLTLPWRLVRIWGGEHEEQFSFRVTALAFHPDDRHLAVGSGPPSRYGDLQVLSVDTGEVVRDYGQVHSDTILALQYSPDGRWLASAGADKLCRLHDPQTGAQVKILEGHTHFVQGLSWHQQAQSLATASADKTIKTWDVETGERRQSIGGFGKEITAIAYVGDSEQVVSGALDGQARLHRGDNAQLVRNFAPTSQPIYSLSLSADGRQVLVGDHAGQLRIYQVEDGQLLRQWPE